MADLNDLTRSESLTTLLVMILHGFACQPFTLSYLRRFMIRKNINPSILDFLTWHQRYALRFAAQSEQTQRGSPAPYSGLNENTDTTIEQHHNVSRKGSFGLGKGAKPKTSNTMQLFGVVPESVIKQNVPSFSSYLQHEREQLARIAEEIRARSNSNEDVGANEISIAIESENTLASETIQGVLSTNAFYMPPAMQPFRQECEQAWRYFILQRETAIPLSPLRQQELRRLLDRTTHPTLFSILVHHCQQIIVREVLPDFVHEASQNISAPSRRWRYISGIALILGTLVLSVLTVLTIENRWFRASLMPFFCTGALFLFQAQEGVCVFLAKSGVREVKLVETYANETAPVSAHNTMTELPLRTKSSRLTGSTYVDNASSSAGANDTATLNVVDSILLSKHTCIFKLQTLPNLGLGQSPTILDDPLDCAECRRALEQHQTMRVEQHHLFSQGPAEPVDSWLLKHQVKRSIRIILFTVFVSFVIFSGILAIPEIKQ